MVHNVEPLLFPPGDIGREFVRYVFLTGMLPKLDANAPYHRWIFCGGLGLHAEKIAEKGPVGLNSEEGFTQVDENRDVAD
jgi:hypothetical protein